MLFGTFSFYKLANTEKLNSHLVTLIAKAFRTVKSNRLNNNLCINNFETNWWKLINPKIIRNCQLYLLGNDFATW